jgi:hypothetical protein
MLSKDDVARFAVLQAVQSAIGDEVSTRKSGNARSAVDDHFKELHELTGAKSFDIEFDGRKLGTYSVKVSSPGARLEVADRAALMEWCREHGAVEERPDMDAVAGYVEDTGELPPGVDLVKSDGGYAGGTLRVDKSVKDEIKEQLAAGAAMRLLETGEEQQHA